MATKFEIETIGGQFRGIVRDASGAYLEQTRLYYNRKNARAAAVALKYEVDSRRADIIVIEDMYAPRSDYYVATFGDFDLDCLTGRGHTPLDAIVDLLDKAEA